MNSIPQSIANAHIADLRREACLARLARSARNQQRPRRARFSRH